MKTIATFIKTECMNHDSYYNCCSIDGQPCKVLSGLSRCGYLEKSVLGPVDYRYKLPGYDYAKIYGEYAEVTSTKAVKVRQRRCECGEPLQHRQRYCKSCKNIKARAASRDRQRNFRFANSPVVTL